MMGCDGLSLRTNSREIPSSFLKCLLLCVVCLKLFGRTYGLCMLVKHRRSRMLHTRNFLFFVFSPRRWPMPNLGSAAQPSAASEKLIESVDISNVNETQLASLCLRGASVFLPLTVERVHR